MFWSDGPHNEGRIFYILYNPLCFYILPYVYTKRESCILTLFPFHYDKEVAQNHVEQENDMQEHGPMKICTKVSVPTQEEVDCIRSEKGYD